MHHLHLSHQRAPTDVRQQGRRIEQSVRLQLFAGAAPKVFTVHTMFTVHTSGRRVVEHRRTQWLSDSGMALRRWRAAAAVGATIGAAVTALVGLCQSTLLTGAVSGAAQLAHADARLVGRGLAPVGQGRAIGRAIST